MKVSDKAAMLRELPPDELKPLKTDPEDVQDDEPEDEPKRKTQAETLISLVENAGAAYYRTDMDELYTSIFVNGHKEVMLIEGRDNRGWLSGLYYRSTGKTINNEALNQAIQVMSAKARFDTLGTTIMSTRIAERDGAIWYDLTNDKWQAVKIHGGKWTVEDNPPVMFVRYRHQSSQVLPQPGGDIRKILDYINLKGNETLFLCYLVSCFIPNIPHPALITYGEKGAAKSTSSEFIKTIVDPSSLLTLTVTNDPRSMAVSLQSHYYLPFDNVSYISEEMSDTLCRASTGGGIQQRKLFTNSEDAIFTFLRCILLNGINCMASRPDLLDRSLLVELERITEDDRRELAEIRSEFEVDRASIIGGIFDVLAKAMKIYPTVKLSKLPRMADFARWGYAIGEALGGHGQTFLDEYAANRESQNIEAINNDAVATLIVEFMQHRNEWDGSVSSLYSSLVDIAGEHNINTRSKSFPPDSARLAKRMNGIKSNLEVAGIGFEKHRDKKSATIRLYRLDLPTPPTPPAHPLQRNDSNCVSKKELPTPTPATYTVPTPLKPLHRNDSVSGVGSDGKKALSVGRI